VSGFQFCLANNCELSFPDTPLSECCMRFVVRAGSSARMLQPAGSLRAAGHHCTSASPRIRFGHTRETVVSESCAIHRLRAIPIRAIRPRSFVLSRRTPPFETNLRQSFAAMSLAPFGTPDTPTLLKSFASVAKHLPSAATVPNPGDGSSVSRACRARSAGDRPDN
jgi:hypothetical protein